MNGKKARKLRKAVRLFGKLEVKYRTIKVKKKLITIPILDDCERKTYQKSKRG